MTISTKIRETIPIPITTISIIIITKKIQYRLIKPTNLNEVIDLNLKLTHSTIGIVIINKG